MSVGKIDLQTNVYASVLQDKKVETSKPFLPSFPENIPNRFKSKFEDLTHTMTIVKKNKKAIDSWGDAWKILNARIDKIPDLQKNVAALVQVIAEQNWNASILDDKTLYPYYGLAAVRENLLSHESLSTLLFYWSLHQYHPREDIKIVKLFDMNISSRRLRTKLINPHQITKSLIWC